MAEFLPRQGPVYEDTDLRNLVKWVESEFQKLARSQQEAGLVPMQELHVAVDKPREGMIIRADGTNWNPGQGKGTYERVNGVWRKMHGFPADGDYGDITVGGTGTTLIIDNDAVTNAKLANMADSTIKGRAVGAGTGDPTDLSGTQATAILDVFTSALKGLVPASGGGTTNFLRADGSFAAPPAPTAVTRVAEDSVGTGTTFTRSGLNTAHKLIVVFFNGLTHNNGASQNLRVELSGDNGASGWSSPITLTQAAFSAASLINGMFCVGMNNGTSGYIGSQVSGNSNGAVTVPGTSGGSLPDAFRLSWSAGNFDGGTTLTFTVS